MLLQRLVNVVPLWLLVLGVVAVLEIFSVGLMLVSRRKWGIDRLKLNNEVAGFKFSVIGVLYAVLLAFVVIAVWENYNATDTAIRNEAKAVGDLTQLSYALPEQEGSAIRASLSDYVKDVRKTEWGTMALGLQARRRPMHLRTLPRRFLTCTPINSRITHSFSKRSICLQRLRTIATNGWIALMDQCLLSYGSCSSPEL